MFGNYSQNLICMEKTGENQLSIVGLHINNIKQLEFFTPTTQPPELTKNNTMNSQISPAGQIFF